MGNMIMLYYKHDIRNWFLDLLYIIYCILFRTKPNEQRSVYPSWLMVMNGIIKHFNGYVTQGDLETYEPREMT